MEFDPKAILHWSDDHLIIINKPSGLLSLPDGYDPELQHIRSLLEPLLGRLWIVHRLDRGTSGLMALARSASAHRDLNRQFDQSEVFKLYHAVVEGQPEWSEQRIAYRLRKDGDRRHRTVIDSQKGKNARTDVSVLARGNNRALVATRPHTGRTHQIRAHLAAVGHPITGDALYGHGVVTGSRLALHAAQLGFIHPMTGEALHFEIPDPEEFDQLLQTHFNQI
jgi:RluA family pseudouridine synthase